MAGTFPGVLAWQLVAAPVVIVVITALVGAGLFLKLIGAGPATTISTAVVGAVSLVAILFVVCLIGVLSLIGFYEGWRIGWKYGCGQDIRPLIEASGPFRGFRAMLRKLRVMR